MLERGRMLSPTKTVFIIPQSSSRCARCSGPMLSGPVLTGERVVLACLWCSWERTETDRSWKARAGSRARTGKISTEEQRAQLRAMAEAEGFPLSVDLPPGRPRSAPQTMPGE
jgi:hypothetical protein